MKKNINKWLKLSTRFPYIHIRNRARASLVIVKDLSRECKTDAEKILYDRLRIHDYYPTPHYSISGIKINMALIPYRLALVERKKGVDEKKIIRLLKRHRWSVIFYSSDQIIEDDLMYMNLVLKYAPNQTKTVSTS